MIFLGSMCCVFFYLFFVLFYITATGIFRRLGKGNGILEQQDRFWVIGIRPFYIMELQREGRDGHVLLSCALNWCLCR